jgi:hypothetical protein
LNPWRLPKTGKSKTIVVEAIRLLKHYEKHFTRR